MKERDTLLFGRRLGRGTLPPNHPAHACLFADGRRTSATWRTPSASAAGCPSWPPTSPHGRWRPALPCLVAARRNAKETCLVPSTCSHPLFRLRHQPSYSYSNTTALHPCPPPPGLHGLRAADAAAAPPLRRVPHRRPAGRSGCASAPPMVANRPLSPPVRHSKVCVLGGGVPVQERAGARIYFFPQPVCPLRPQVNGHRRLGGFFPPLRSNPQRAVRRAGTMPSLVCHGLGQNSGKVGTVTSYY